MENITCAAELKIAIKQLELERDIQGQVLKEEFFHAYESLKPVNILKNTLNDISTSPLLIDNMLGSSVGLVTGYLSKLITVGATHNPFKKAIGSVLQFGVTNFIAQHPDAIKSIAHFLMNQIFRKNEFNTKKR